MEGRREGGRGGGKESTYQSSLGCVVWWTKDQPKTAHKAMKFYIGL